MTKYHSINEWNTPLDFTTLVRRHQDSYQAFHLNYRRWLRMAVEHGDPQTRAKFARAVAAARALWPESCADIERQPF